MNEQEQPHPAGPELQTNLSKERTGLSHERTGLSHERTALSHERSDLSSGRTRLALERTLMAWVRTGTSLISFGFTIYKFLEDKPTAEGGPRLGARYFGLAMILTGLLSLLFASFQHYGSLSNLKAGRPPSERSLALPVALLVSGLGIFGLLVIAFRF